MGYVFRQYVEAIDITFKNSVLPVTILAIGSLCLWVLYDSHYTEAAARLCVRLTALSSYALLIAAFVARPWWQLTHSDRAKTALAARRQIGLSMAASHSYHLAMIGILTNIAWLGDWSQHGSLRELSPAIFLYSLIYAMALTSNDWSRRFLGPFWRILHRTGIYILMLGFTGNYLGLALEEGGFYWLWTGFGVAAFALRALAWLKNRRDVRRRRQQLPA